MSSALVTTSANPLQTLPFLDPQRFEQALKTFSAVQSNS